MSDQKPKKRIAPISYRPPVDLCEEFHQRIKKSDLSVSAFITKAIFGQNAPRQSRRLALATKHKNAQEILRSRHITETKRIKIERSHNRPKGLAGFLGRVTGVELVRKKIHQYQDKKRLNTYLDRKNQLTEKHAEKSADLQHRQEMQKLDIGRKLDALAQIEKRERRSLEESLRRDVRIHARNTKPQMPSLDTTLKPKDREEEPKKTKTKSISPPFHEKAKVKEVQKEDHQQSELENEFSRTSVPDPPQDREGTPSDPPKVRRYGPEKQRDIGNDREP